MPVSDAEFHALRTLVRQMQSRFRWGTGDPNGAVDAPQGSLFERDDTGDVYRKSTALGVLTGWTAL